jgi:hypothetical protein
MWRPLVRRSRSRDRNPTLTLASVRSADGHGRSACPGRGLGERRGKGYRSGQQRGIIRELLTITILPATRRGRAWNPGSVRMVRRVLSGETMQRLGA